MSNKDTEEDAEKIGKMSKEDKSAAAADLSQISADRKSLGDRFSFLKRKKKSEEKSAPPVKDVVKAPKVADLDDIKKELVAREEAKNQAKEQKTLSSEMKKELLAREQIRKTAGLDTAGGKAIPKKKSGDKAPQITEPVKEKRHFALPKFSGFKPKVEGEKTAPTAKPVKEKRGFSLPIPSAFKPKGKKKPADTIREEIKKEISQKKKKKKFKKRQHMTLYWIEKAGLSIGVSKLTKNIFIASIIITLIVSGFVLYQLATRQNLDLTVSVAVLLFFWTLGLASAFILLWLTFFMYIDIRVFKRRSDIEIVLPDYLLLTASNIRAGMTTERALWYAVRPRFGVLAKEMETVAKQTASGEDLSSALRIFANKYDSKILKRAVALLVESSEAGGEIGDLLEKIAKNVQDVKLMQKEMAANVMTYVIFISFAAVVAAPILYALAGQMLFVISTIIGGLNISEEVVAGSLFSIGEVGVSEGDYLIFAVVNLLVTSILSAMIVAVIRKGEVRSGLRVVPIYAGISLVLYFGSSWAFHQVFAGLL